MIARIRRIGAKDGCSLHQETIAHSHKRPMQQGPSGGARSSLAPLLSHQTSFALAGGKLRRERTDELAVNCNACIHSFAEANGH